MSASDVIRNYARIATVWLDDEYRDLFYKANKITLSHGKPSFDIGDISGIIDMVMKIRTIGLERKTSLQTFLMVCEEV